jgi:predicted nucleotidyltransferase
MKSNRNITVPHAALAEFCRRHHIRKLSFFGSVLREDFRPDSDVDVLVEFEPGHVPGFFRLGEISQELSSLLGGRRVDLRTPRDLSPHFREEVIASAESVYG